MKILHLHWWKYHFWPPYRKKVKAFAKELVIPGLIDEMIIASNPILRNMNRDKIDKL
jgi:hypothetical protein